MVQETVTVDAGPRQNARAGQATAGNVQAGTDTGIRAVETVVAPETVTVTGTATPDAAVTATAGSDTATPTVTATPETVTSAYASEVATVLATVTPETVTSAYASEVATAVTEALPSVRDNARAHRIVHRDEIHGVFAPLDSDIAGLFADESEIDGLIEREDR
jgi:hypothetical protein